jgi:putative ABC transport system permease protein
VLLRILWRSAFRHRLRTALTVLAVVIAVLAFALLRTVVDAWYAGVAQSSATRLVTRNAISLVFPLPLYYRDRIRQVDGVTVVAHGDWFGGYYLDPKNFFANFAVEPRSYLALYPEYRLSEAERTAFLRDRRSAIVGRKLADRFGWKAGDDITLKGTIFPGDWGMRVAGVYRGRDRTTDESLLLFHWDYLNETVKRTAPDRADRVGFFVLGVEQADAAATVARGIDTLFENSGAETLTETEKAFQLGFVSMSEAILNTVRLVSMAVIGVLLAVVANTMAMSVRERLPEYAVFKTLGFGGRHLALLIVGESLVITGAGAALGLALTFPVVGAFARVVGQFFPSFQVSGTTMALGLSAALGVGLASGLLPLRQALRVGITEGLRRLG